MLLASPSLCFREDEEPRERPRATLCPGIPLGEPLGACPDVGCSSPPREVSQTCWSVIKTSTSGCWHNLFPSSLLLFADSQTPVFLTETRKTLNRVLWEGGAAVGAQLIIGFNFTFGSSRGGFSRAGVGVGGAVTEGLAPSCGHGDICSRPCFPRMAGLGKHFRSMVGNKPVRGSFSIPALLSQFSSLTEQNPSLSPKKTKPLFSPSPAF